jgi:Domain of unknown function (DUF4332)
LIINSKFKIPYGKQATKFKMKEGDKEDNNSCLLPIAYCLLPIASYPFPLPNYATIYKYLHILNFNMSAKHTFTKTSLAACDWPIEQLPGLSQQELSQLQNCGIVTTGELMKQGKTLEARVGLANKLQVHLQYLNKWLALADLARIPGVGTQNCGLLLHAGVGSVAQLAETPTHRLHRQILRLQVATMQRRDLCPAIEQVQQWSQQAKVIRNS